MTHNELENLELFNPKAFPKLRPGVKFLKSMTRTINKAATIFMLDLATVGLK